MDFDCVKRFVAILETICLLLWLWGKCRRQNLQIMLDKQNNQLSFGYARFFHSLVDRLHGMTLNLGWVSNLG